jgi:hypothetical protein
MFLFPLGEYVLATYKLATGGLKARMGLPIFFKKYEK